MEEMGGMEWEKGFSLIAALLESSAAQRKVVCSCYNHIHCIFKVQQKPHDIARHRTEKQELLQARKPTSEMEMGRWVMDHFQ